MSLSSYCLDWFPFASHMGMGLRLAARFANNVISDSNSVLTTFKGLVYLCLEYILQNLKTKWHVQKSVAAKCELKAVK